MKKAIMFDLDGTLWDSSKQVTESWNEVLSGYGRQITQSDMQGFMGKTLEEIFDIAMPDTDKDERDRIRIECCDNEHAYVRQHGGILYPNVENTLEILHEKYFLAIVSNSQDGYVQAFLDYTDFSKYFDDIEMAGRTNLNKAENISLVIRRNNIDKAIYVGDTVGDYNSSILAEVPFVHAKYGFGKFDCEYFVDDFSQLPEIADKILN